MDHKEQQDQELEALESIFPHEYNLIQKDPLGVFTFDLKSKDYDDEPEEGARILIKFTYTPLYPDEIPNCELEEIENFGDAEEVIEFVDKIAAENVSMPMIYTIIVALMEKLDVDNENRKRREKEEKERREKEREAEEQRRFDGTKVNVESFLKWKKTFDKEMAELKRASGAVTVQTKQTGKQLFEMSDAFINSDIQFVAENADENIEVDESLFQNLEGLDIGDEDDDPDYTLDDDEEDDTTEEE